MNKLETELESYHAFLDNKKRTSLYWTYEEHEEANSVMEDFQNYFDGVRDDLVKAIESAT